MMLCYKFLFSRFDQEDGIIPIFLNDFNLLNNRLNKPLHFAITQDLPASVRANSLLYYFELTEDTLKESLEFINHHGGSESILPTPDLPCKLIDGQL